MSGVSGVGGSYGGMSQQEVTALAKQLNAEASTAGQLIDAFSKANELISDPEKAGLSAQESMQATFDFNVNVVNRSLMNKMGKGLNVDVEV